MSQDCDSGGACRAEILNVVSQPSFGAPDMEFCGRSALTRDPASSPVGSWARVPDPAHSDLSSRGDPRLSSADGRPGSRGLVVSPLRNAESPAHHRMRDPGLRRPACRCRLGAQPETGGLTTQHRLKRSERRYHHADGAGEAAWSEGTRLGSGGACSCLCVSGSHLVPL